MTGIAETQLWRFRLSMARTVGQLRLRRVVGRLRNPYHEEHDRLRAVFVHVPKAAGNSVTKAIYGCSSLSLGGHVPASRFAVHSPEKFRDYRFFSFVRDPYDRLYSAFTFLSEGGMTEDDQRFAARLRLRHQTFESFVLGLKEPGFRQEVMAYWHFRPQAYWLCGFRGQLIVPEVFRQEHLDEDLARLAGEITGKPRTAKENVTKRSSAPPDFSPEMCAVVSACYAPDFLLLGYSRQISPRDIGTTAMKGDCSIAG